jgi:hypothetical protein
LTTRLYRRPALPVVSYVQIEIAMGFVVGAAIRTVLVVPKRARFPTSGAVCDVAQVVHRYGNPSAVRRVATP